MNNEKYESYFEEFNKPEKNEKNEKVDVNREKEREANSRLEKAYNAAVEIRKFEIELYWKRATYFWTFIAATFAGYALIYTKGSNGKESILLLFSCLGLLFSWAWFLVNKGSKYWQDNWERHVDLLEDKVVGPLYKIIAEKPYKSGIGWFINPSPYSVSKINQLLSIFICFFWVALIINDLKIWEIFPQEWLSKIWEILPNRLHNIWKKVGLLSFTLAMCFILFRYTNSDHKKKDSSSPPEETEIHLKKRKIYVSKGIND